MNKKLRLISIMLLLSIGLICAACAPHQAVEKPAANTDAEASSMEMPTWSPSSDCASCHTAEADSADSAAAGYSVHAIQPDITCTACHADDNGKLGKAHEDYSTAKPSTALKKTEVSPESCTATGCHDKEEVAAKTADTTILTDDNGLTVNPHDLPASEDHDLILCTSCHEMHSGTSVEDQAPKSCKTCHHKGTYECGTCH